MLTSGARRRRIQQSDRHHQGDHTVVRAEMDALTFRCDVDCVLLQQGDDAGLLLWVVRVQRHPDLAVLAESVVQGGLLLWDPRLVGKAGRRGGQLDSGDLAEGIEVVLAPFLVWEEGAGCSRELEEFQEYVRGQCPGAVLVAHGAVSDEEIPGVILRRVDPVRERFGVFLQFPVARPEEPQAEGPGMLLSPA